MQDGYKECAFCGERCDPSSIQCHKCGGGVFAAEKTHCSTNMEQPVGSSVPAKRKHSTLWCCPNCNTILRKPSYSDGITEFMEGGSPLGGRITCVTCHRESPPSDVYGGKYDVIKKTDDRGEPVYVDVNGKYYVNRSGKHWGNP